MVTLSHSTIKVAAWNLGGYGGISDCRLQLQSEGLALLDADVIALVEINPLCATEKLCSNLEKYGVRYSVKALKQSNDLNIGIIYKDGITVKNVSLMGKSDLNDFAN